MDIRQSAERWMSYLNRTGVSVIETSLSWPPMVNLPSVLKHATKIRLCAHVIPWQMCTLGDLPGLDTVQHPLNFHPIIWHSILILSSQGLKGIKSGQWDGSVKATATESDCMGSVPRADVIGRRNWLPHAVFCLHKQTVVHTATDAHACTHAHAHT